MATGSQAPVSTVDMVDPFGDGSGVALYKFDGDATNESGTYNGTATGITYGTGKFGQCCVFNGSNSRVNITQPYNSTNVSVSCWVLNNNPVDTKNNKYICGLNSGASNFLALICSQRTTDSCDLWFYSAPWVKTVTINLSRTEFSHIVASVSSINGVTVYLNGKLIMSDSTLKQLNNTSVNNSTIGSERSLYTNTFWNGKIDQFRIINKALSQKEVTALYNEYDATPYIPPQGFFNDGTELAHYKFDGDATDSIGRYNGTATSITYGTGKFGQCGVFNGRNSKIVTSTRVNTGQNFSVSCWTRVNDFGDGGIHNHRANMSNGAEGQIGVDQGQLITNIINSSNIFIATTSFPLFLLSLDVWYNLSFTYNGSKIIFYINGDNSSSAISVIGAGTVSNGASFLAFGMAGFDLTNSALAFNGSIDNSRIFNRALTQEEVTALYNEGL